MAYEINETKRNVAIVFASFVFITSLVLFCVSFDKVEPTQVGLVWNNNLKKLYKSDVYENGRYILGVGLWFIKYPINLQTITFKGSSGANQALSAWSAEGQSLELDLSFQYRLDRTKVGKLYERYQTDYNYPLRLIAERVIKEVVIQYTTVEFFSKRSEISAALKSALANRFADEYAFIEIVNLRAINIPDKFEDKIIEKVVQAQQYKTAINKRTTAISRAQVNIIEGQASANVSLILAKANAQKTQIVQAARSEAYKLLRSQESESYSALQSTLGLNSTRLLQYRFSQFMTDLEGSLDGDLKFVVGFDSPVVEVSP